MPETNEATTTTKDPIYIAKLSIKTMGCDPKGVFKRTDGKSQPLCRIYGKASETRMQEDKLTGNISTAIIGNFEGENFETHEIYRSGKLYLPKGIAEILESAVKEVEKDNGTVEFAFEVSSVKANNPIGYSYEARSLVKPTEADDLAQIRSRMLRYHTTYNALVLPKPPAVKEVEKVKK